LTLTWKWCSLSLGSSGLLAYRRSSSPRESVPFASRGLKSSGCVATTACGVEML
jgi:hypothetical protein